MWSTLQGISILYNLYWYVCYEVVEVGEYELVTLIVSQVMPTCHCHIGCQRIKSKENNACNFDFVYIN